MLKFSLIKQAVIIGLCAIGIVMALPNAFYDRVERHNDALSAFERSGSMTPEQEADALRWPDFLPSGLVNLGLDLRGGAHLLAQVHVEDVYASRMDALWPEVRDLLRDLRGDIGTIRRQDGPADQLRIRVSRPENIARAVEEIRRLAQPVVSLTGASSTDIEVRSEGSDVVISLSEAEKLATDQRTVAQSLEIIRRRVDEAGTREPTIQRQGDQRVLIQVPGIGSAEELKGLIGQTAKLSFHSVIDVTFDGETRVSSTELLHPSADREGQFYILERTPVLTGEQLVDARPDFDQQTNLPAVSFTLNTAGGRVFGEYTAANMGQLFAIALDGEVISAATINGHITTRGIITGSFSVEETNKLAILLRAGALPAGMTFLEERTIGPELGQDSIDAGRIASLIAFAGVLIFMVLSYGLFGVFANIALIFNVGLLFGLLSMIGATLTLPGIAGIVLTIGMAVDANVLIFERIREEIKTAKGPIRAIELGYERALSAIFDANITTLIAAMILFFMGSGPVRGFAVTLGLGIFTSVFTAIWVTRLLIYYYVRAKRPKTLRI